MLEPNVAYRDGQWLMWYGSGPDADRLYRIGLAESQDGKTWSSRRIAVEPEAFDATPMLLADRTDLIVARLFLLRPDHPQAAERAGLWWHSTEAEPRRILRTGDGTRWHAGGVWKPAGHIDQQQAHIFFNAMGTTEAGRLGTLSIAHIVLTTPQ